MSQASTTRPRVITRNWQVQVCEHWAWDIEPDTETGKGGRGHSCGHRASYRIELTRVDYDGTSTPETTHRCRAHLGEELDREHRARTRWHHHARRQIPAPVVTEMRYAVDVRAHAHGKHRLLLTEHRADQPIELELFATTPPLRVPPRRHRPDTTRPAHLPPLTLFDLPTTNRRAA